MDFSSSLETAGGLWFFNFVITRSPVRLALLLSGKGLSPSIAGING